MSMLSAVAAAAFRLPPLLPFAAGAGAAASTGATGGRGGIAAATSAITSAAGAGIGSEIDSSSTNGNVPVYKQQFKRQKLDEQT